METTKIFSFICRVRRVSQDTRHMREVSSSHTKVPTSNQGAPTKTARHSSHTRTVARSPTRQEASPTRRTCTDTWMRCLQVQEVLQVQEEWTKSWGSYIRMPYLHQGEY